MESNSVTNSNFSDISILLLGYKPQTKARTYPSNEIESRKESDDSNTSFLPISKRNFEFQNMAYKASVFDIAAYILSKMGEMTTMKLHKLLYYCQAWSLVWDDKPMYEEDIEAWANGPVIRILFSYHRGNYMIKNLNIGNPDLVTNEQKETIDSVLDFYGNKSSHWLIDLTHKEKPWIQARAGLSPMERGNNTISLSSMAEYYSSL